MKLLSGTLTALGTVLALCVGLTMTSTATASVPSSDVMENTSQPDIEIWLGEGVGRYGDREFKVLGGSKKHPSPTGAFKVEWKSRKWWSKQYDASMPYAVFYFKGSALHQGSMRSRSHGCIHLTEETAKFLYKVGKADQTRIFVYP